MVIGVVVRATVGLASMAVVAVATMVVGGIRGSKFLEFSIEEGLGVVMRAES